MTHAAGAAEALHRDPVSLLRAAPAEPLFSGVWPGAALLRPHRFAGAAEAPQAHRCGTVSRGRATRCGGTMQAPLQRVGITRRLPQAPPVTLH